MGRRHNRKKTKKVKRATVTEQIRGKLKKGVSFRKISAEISRSHQVSEDDLYREIMRQYSSLVQSGEVR